MSVAADEKECKGGHPPALKAGNMRFTRHKPVNHDKDSKVPDLEENSPFKVSTSPPKSASAVSGVPMKSLVDQPAAAIQSFHDKPKPTVDSRSTHPTKPVIHQPRK